jgi:aerobic carbon-monoxide dehydrogenase medium subunit
VKPSAFDYHRPATLADVFDYFGRLTGDVRVIAGGQSLVPMLNLRIARPDHLIDLNNLAELDYVRESEAYIEIGSLTRHHRLATDWTIQKAVPILAAAARSIGNYAVRQRGTIGGSLAQGDPSAQLPLLAVLFDAKLRIVSRSGERTVHGSDFFKSVMTTALDAGEILVAAQFPKVTMGMGWGIELFSHRQGDFAIVASAALIEIGRRGLATKLRLALGGVSTIPISLNDIIKPFLGQAPDEVWVRRLTEVVERNCPAQDDGRYPVQFRRELARVLTRRALLAAIARAQKVPV